MSVFFFFFLPSSRHGFKTPTQPPARKQWRSLQHWSPLPPSPHTHIHTHDDRGVCWQCKREKRLCCYSLGDLSSKVEGCFLMKPLFPDLPALVCVYKGKHDSEFHSSLMRETETETDKGRGGASYQRERGEGARLARTERWIRGYFLIVSQRLCSEAPNNPEGVWVPRCWIFWEFKRRAGFF